MSESVKNKIFSQYQLANVIKFYAYSICVIWPFLELGMAWGFWEAIEPFGNKTNLFNKILLGTSVFLLTPTAGWYGAYVCLYRENRTYQFKNGVFEVLRRGKVIFQATRPEIADFHCSRYRAKLFLTLRDGSRIILRPAYVDEEFQKAFVKDLEIWSGISLGHIPIF